MALTKVTSGAVSGLATSATTDTTDASNITTGTIPTARLDSTLDLSSKTVTLPAASVTAHATNPTKASIEALGIDLPAADLTGTIADARFPSTLPAISGANLTGIDAVVVGTTLPNPVSPEGSLFYKSDTDIFYISNGTQWKLVSNASPATTGGTVTIGALSEGGTFTYDLGTDFTDDVDTDAQLTYTLTSGTMPTGCTLPTTGNSALTGTASGVSSNTNYTWQIKATDTSGGTATQNYQQTINTVVPTVTGGTVTISSVQEGLSASYDVNTNFTFTTGSTFSAYSLLSGSLPSGLSFNTSTGVISGTMGTVSADTAYSFTIRGTDTDGDTVDQAYSWTITDTPVSATGGTITTYSVGATNYKVHTFTSSGSFVVSQNTTSTTLDILIVAAGGSGGAHGGGGGGAGGMLEYTTQAMAVGTKTVTIGGGSTSANGGNTTVTGFTTAIGGGRGAQYNYHAAASGGSGGGTTFILSYSTANGGSGTAGQGNDGGDTNWHNIGNHSSAGGGGKAAEGDGYQNGAVTSYNSKAGDGGDGKQNNYDNNNYYYAGGGGGAIHYNANAGDGGLGGGGGGSVGSGAAAGAGGGSARNAGGAGAVGSSAVGGTGGQNTGGGSGGTRKTGSSGYASAAPGGSGIVIIRYEV